MTIHIRTFKEFDLHVLERTRRRWVCLVIVAELAGYALNARLSARNIARHCHRT
jgi:hypothetical protein